MSGPNTRTPANRTVEEWDQLVNAATEILLEQGRKHDPTISYSALNTLLEERTGQAKFNLDLQEDRNALGGVLADVNDRTLPMIESAMGRKALLSTLVMHKGSSDLGGGYYAYAWNQGMLTSRTAEARDLFLVQQLKVIADYCKRELA